MSIDPMTLEMQQQELEALQCIFTEEYEELSTEYPVSFKLNLADKNSEPSIDRIHHPFSLSLLFTLGLDYPNSEAPTIEIDDTENMTDEIVAELKAFCDQLAQDNLGMPSTFTIASEVQEWMVSRFKRAVEEYEAEESRRAAEEEEAERNRFAGSRVTALTFFEWKRKFDAEMALLEQQANAQNSAKKKLTARKGLRDRGATGARSSRSSSSSRLGRMRLGACDPMA
ncbi:hypothetical protein H696_04387 [Fonticula alba]|uniref:RWD domain-containing protein n=1 Tax=Fonticula alba TaxID=691883 RepID=A0A058Z652_FONAL|nr:hypothetical protein H696_04387 [Fonticula alba]KCV68967.1 hypothetical protein H696_04387 [Fonticula alba]|eukprot:XP_009496538.1 hypothetical protein H696_04387 [Fonticula alba]